MDNLAENDISNDRTGSQMQEYFSIRYRHYKTASFDNAIGFKDEITKDKLEIPEEK